MSGTAGDVMLHHTFKGVQSGNGFAWLIYTPVNVLAPGRSLSPAQGLASPDGRYHLWMQSDGNLVLYDGSQAIWATNTWSRPGTVAVMQTDGNLVLYQNGAAIWASNTWDAPDAYLLLQPDGNLVIRTACCVRWATNTAR